MTQQTTKMSIEECKDILVKKQGYNNLEDFLADGPHTDNCWNDFIDEAMQLYGEQFSSNSKMDELEEWVNEEMIKANNLSLAVAYRELKAVRNRIQSLKINYTDKTNKK